MGETEPRFVPERMAVCSCGAPLIGTFLFHYKEFICLEDGRLYEFFGPTTVDTTPELWERFVALEAEFNEIMKDAIISHSRHVDCEQCEGGEDHIRHATPDELRASDRAFSELHKRCGRQVA